MNALQENKTVSKIMTLIKKILIRSFVFSRLLVQSDIATANPVYYLYINGEAPAHLMRTDK